MLQFIHNFSGQSALFQRSSEKLLDDLNILSRKDNHHGYTGHLRPAFKKAST